MDILAYKGTSFWPSKLIEWFNRSEYSHVSIRDDDGSEYEAWPPKFQHVKKWGSNHTKGTVVDIFETKIPLTEEEKMALRVWLESQIGKPYDWRGVFRFLSRTNRGDEGELFCSEATHLGFSIINIFLQERIISYKVYPGMITISPLLRFKETVVVE